MYIDEDSWQVALVDHYDGRGQLWRVGEGHAEYHYGQQVSGYTLEALYDIIAGRYIALGLKNEEKHGTEFGFKASGADYTRPPCATPASADPPAPPAPRHVRGACVPGLRYGAQSFAAIALHLPLPWV